MIVIALLGLFFVAARYMNRDVRIDQTKAERLANVLYDQIRVVRNNMMIGKGVASGSTSSLTVADERTITISATGITTSYTYGSSFSGVESRLPVPFFDNDYAYQISDISVSSGSIIPGLSSTVDMNGITMATIVYKANGDIIIAASKIGSAISTPIRTLRIQTRYGNFSRYVSVDRVTGITEILLAEQTGSTSGNNMTTGVSCALGGTPVAHGSSIIAYLQSSVAYNDTCSSESRTCANGVLSGSYTKLSCNVTPGLSCTLPWGGSVNHGISTTAYSSTTVNSPATCASVSQSRLCTNGLLDGSYTNQSCSVLSSCGTAGSPYPACTALGQVYSATSTYPGCNTPDKAICTCVGTATVWSMCNVGSTIAGTTSASYGSMFQWGRNLVFPSTGSVPATAGPLSSTAANATISFITNSASPNDWLTPQDNTLWGTTSMVDTTATYANSTTLNQSKMQGPCPISYHVPTNKEASDTIYIGLGSNLSQFNTTLLPPLAGIRDASNSGLSGQGTNGYWWLSSGLGGGSPAVYWNSSAVNANTSPGYVRANAFSVRCIKN